MCEPERTDRPTSDVLLDRGGDDLRRGQPDALVDHLEAGVPCAHGDLLGAVGVPVEPGLADQQPQPAAPSSLAGARGPGRAPRPARVAAGRRRRRADPGRRAVLAEHLAQRAGPLAGGHAGPGASSVAAIRFASVSASRAQPVQRRGDRGRRPARPATLDASTAAASTAGSTRWIAPAPVGGQRRRLGLGEPVDADDDLVAGLDPAAPRGAARRPARSSCSRLDRRDRAAQRQHPLHLGPRPLDELGACASTTCEPSNRSPYSSRSDSKASTCWIRSDHCWSHGRGRPSASFQAGSCTARARASCDRVTPSISSTMRWTLFSGCASVRPSEFTCTP